LTITDAPTDGRIARGQERRDEIARAVIDVVAAHGLRGLTHRKVAEAAGVPLGSTTYHFETLDDLMMAGLELAADRNLAMMRRAAERLAPGDDVATWLTDLVIEMVTTWRESNIAERELYLEAIRSPALRPAATRWDDQFVDVLEPHLGDREAARLACWALDGLAITLLMADGPPHRERILRQMTRLCADLSGP
jgi:TetR/AcrR family transcriptional regulator, regulator of biofilm formation and stress response